ncbi:MAG: hypothetical protein HOY69_29920, partial [Streptomyces sp.]|nr:hypothetical protein [Streptomyces sp.]
YVAAYDQVAATFVAGILCSGTSREAFGWLTQRRLLNVTWPLEYGGSTNADYHRILTLLLLDHRDRDWQRDLALRLAEWLPADRGHGPWLITYGLAAWTETDLPATDGFIRGWVTQGDLISWQGHREIREWFADQGWREPVPRHTTLLSWLRAEPRLAEYVPRLFEVDDVGSELADPKAARFGAENGWPEALTTLANEGVLDRDALLDQCLAKLLRGDRPGNLRGFVALHDRLAPSPDEVAARVGTYVRLAADGAGTAAKAAQKLLKALDTDGRLEPRDFEELCTAVLTRSETTLATAQLTWMDKVVGRDRAQAPALAGAAALAFGHPATAVQERALALAGRWLAYVGPDVQAQLRDAAGSLDAALQHEAARVLGDTGDAPAPSPRLPAPQARKLPPVVGSPGDLAERFAALLVARTIEPMELERVLEGAVVQFHADADAVARAFAPLAARHPAREDAGGWTASGLNLGLDCLMDVLAGRSARIAGAAWTALAEGHSASLDTIPLRRIHEVAAQLQGGKAPFLLATPTRADGSIDLAVLAERLDRFRAEDVTPWPDDLEQALLRLPRGAHAGLADRLPAPSGHATGLPEFASFHTHPRGVEEAPDAFGYGQTSAPRVVPVMTAATEPDAGTLAAVLSRTPDPMDPHPYYWPYWDGRTNRLMGLWPAIAPHHPDVIAAHALPILFSQVESTSNTGDAVLPLLAESGDAAGPVVHLALAYGMTAAGAASRTAALDALLTLAALGRLDGPLLGQVVAALWHEQIARPNRFESVLGEAARAGAAAEVWTAVRALLTHVAGQPSLKGLPALVSLGAECAAAGNIRGGVPELDALALQSKPVRLAKEAKRLQEILRS